MKRILAAASAVLGLVLGSVPSRAGDRLGSLARDLERAAVASGKIRLAVAVFSSADGADPDDGRLLAARILTRLVQGGRVTVVERSLVGPGIQAVVGGAVIDDGDRLEVQARLIDADTGAILFAATERLKPDWRPAADGFLVEPCFGGGGCSRHRSENRRLLKEIRNYENGVWVFSERPDAP